MGIISAAPHANSGAWDDLSNLLRLLADPKGVAGELARLKAAAEDAQKATDEARYAARDAEKKSEAARAKFEEAEATLKNAEAKAGEIIEAANHRAEVEFKRRVRVAMSALDNK